MHPSQPLQTLFWLQLCNRINAEPVKLWNQYELPQGDDELIPVYGEKLEGFWDLANANQGAEHSRSALAKIENDLETKLIMETAKLPFAINSLGSTIAANYFEIGPDGDFSASKTSVLSCLNAKANVDEQSKVLAKIINLLFAGRGKQKTLGLDTILIMAEKKLLRVSEIRAVYSGILFRPTVWNYYQAAILFA